jgi:hypothetical protein
VIALDILCSEGRWRRYSRNDQTPLNYRSQRSVCKSTWNSIRIPMVSETANRPVVPTSGSRVRLHFPDIFRSFSSVSDRIQRDVKAPFFSLVTPFPRYEPLCARHCFIRHINCAPISCPIQPESLLICDWLHVEASLVIGKKRNEETRSEGKRCAGTFLDNRLDDLLLTWIHCLCTADLFRSFFEEGLIEETRNRKRAIDSRGLRHLLLLHKR